MNAYANEIVDHLMFDEDPGSVKMGQAHWVMSYMRAWRPTFIYVLCPFTGRSVSAVR